jgi:hypothetical protein
MGNLGANELILILLVLGVLVVPGILFPGKSIGLAYCILGVCGFIPIVGIITSIAALVCWILYWVKISNYSAELAVPFTAVAT